MVAWPGTSWGAETQHESPCQQEIYAAIWANLVFTSLLHSLVCVFPEGLVNTACRTLGTQNILQLWQNHLVHLCIGPKSTGLSPISLWLQGMTRCMQCVSGALAPGNSDRTPSWSKCAEWKSIGQCLCFELQYSAQFPWCLDLCYPHSGTEVNVRWQELLLEWKRMEHLLCVRHYAKFFIWIISFYPHNYWQ